MPNAVIKCHKGVKCRLGMKKIMIFGQYLALSQKLYKVEA